MKILITFDILLLFMSFIKALMNFLKKLFGGSTTQKVEEEPFNYAEARKKLTEGAKNQLLWGHQIESEKDSILKQVELNEQAGHTRYIIDVNSCYYKISNGTFAQYRKGDWMDSENGMSKYAKDMLVLHHTQAEKEAILKQIADNEAAGVKAYKITIKGGYYNVKNNVVIATM